MEKKWKKFVGDEEKMKEVGKEEEEERRGKGK